MKQSYWHTYVQETDANEIERHLQRTGFPSSGKSFELIYFEEGKNAPTILISPGSGGHAYVFAELGYQMHRRGYNVCIMPKHGGVTINELVLRHSDAVRHISNIFNDSIGLFGEGLGGFVTFYLALAHGPVKSIVCQNAPAILTESTFQEAMMAGKGAALRRKIILPVAKFLLNIVPQMKLPISLYLDWKELIDTKEENRGVETRLVESYMKDPDFDRWYPLSAILSLVFTPPPNSLTELNIPTMFLVPVRGWSDPSYVKDLYNRLPPIKKKLVEVDGSVYWMLSHPKEASTIICEWFAETLSF